MSYATRWVMPVPLKALEDDQRKIARAHTRGMMEAVNGFKEEFREEIVAAGLGERLAKTVRGVTYPDQPGRHSASPTGEVFVVGSKSGRGSAARILEHYISGRDIIPGAAAALAVPTKNTPLTGASRGGKRPMTPVEVEARFNAELFPLRLKSGNIGLFINVIQGLSRRRPGFRQNTAGRRAQGRAPQRVLMFTLTRRVKGRKALGPDRLFKTWGARLPALIGEQRAFAER